MVTWHPRGHKERAGQHVVHTQVLQVAWHEELQLEVCRARWAAGQRAGLQAFQRLYAGRPAPMYAAKALMPP